MANAAGEGTVTVHAPPEEVYALISDVTRTGKWSPECVSVEWLEPGKRFRGHNKQGSREWEMEGVIDVARPPTEFAFHTERDGEVRTRWGYRLAPSSDGTALTEWYERVATVPLIARVVERLLLGGRKKHNDENVRASLDRIKAILEAQ